MKPVNTLGCGQFQPVVSEQKIIKVRKKYQQQLQKNQNSKDIINQYLKQNSEEQWRILYAQNEDDITFEVLDWLVEQVPFIATTEEQKRLDRLAKLLVGLVTGTDPIQAQRNIDLIVQQEQQYIQQHSPQYLLKDGKSLSPAELDSCATVPLRNNREPTPNYSTLARSLAHDGTVDEHGGGFAAQYIQHVIRNPVMKRLTPAGIDQIRKEYALMKAAPPSNEFDALDDIEPLTPEQLEKLFNIVTPTHVIDFVIAFYEPDQYGLVFQGVGMMGGCMQLGQASAVEPPAAVDAPHAPPWQLKGRERDNKRFAYTQLIAAASSRRNEAAQRAAELEGSVEVGDVARVIEVGQSAQTRVGNDEGGDVADGAVSNDGDMANDARDLQDELAVAIGDDLASQDIDVTDVVRAIEYGQKPIDSCKEATESSDHEQHKQRTADDREATISYEASSVEHEQETTGATHGRQQQTAETGRYERDNLFLIDIGQLGVHDAKFIEMRANKIMEVLQEQYMDALLDGKGG